MNVRSILFKYMYRSFFGHGSFLPTTDLIPIVQVAPNRTLKLEYHMAITGKELGL